MSSGWMTWMWAMCGRVSVGPLARRAASTASSPSRTARSPMAWKCGWNPRASSLVTWALSASGSIMLMPRFVGRAAVVIEVRLEDRAGPVLEDAIEEQLDAGRGVAADRGPRSPLDELLDLLVAARPVPPQRPDDTGRQLAATGERRVRDLASTRG